MHLCYIGKTTQQIPEPVNWSVTINLQKLIIEYNIFLNVAEIIKPFVLYFVFYQEYYNIYVAFSASEIGYLCLDIACFM